MNAAHRGLALAALGVFVLSFDALLIKMAQGPAPADVLVFRFGCFFLGLLAICTILGRLGAVWRALAARPGLYILAGLLLATANAGFVTGMQRTSVAHALILFATIPLWAALIARIALGERLRRRSLGAMALAVLGVAILGFGAADGGEASLTGDALALVAAFGAAGALVAARAAGEAGMFPALLIAGGVGALASATFATGEGLDRTNVMVLIVMGGVMLPIAWTLIMAGAKRAPAAEVALDFAPL